MIPLGAIINALGITIGSLVGLAFGARLPERVRAIVFQGLGLCVLVIGFKMALLTQNPLIVIFSIVIGSVAGEMIGLEARLIRVGDWLKGRLKSSNPLFTEGMVNASVLFCIGAMAIVGSIQDGILGDHATLFAKAVLDLVIIMVMTASMGKGCIFSAIPVALLQGGVTLLSRVLAPIFTEAAIANLSYTGSVMIFCVGLNLVWGKKIKVANLLPTLVFAVLYALVF
mgnify:CR=1 FL=1